MKNRLIQVIALVIAACFSASTFAYPDTPAINPFVAATGYVNPDYVTEVSNFFTNNAGYKAKSQKLGLLDANGNWNVSTAIWLDSMQAIVGYPAPRNTHSMLYYLKDAATKATADKPVVITFVVYDLPLRDCDAYSSNGEFKLPTDISKYEANYIGGVSKAKLAQDPTTIVDTLQSFNTVPNAQNVRIVFVIEPDSLPNLITNANATQACQAAVSNHTYTDGISYALTQISQQNKYNNIYMYLDIAHSGWLGWTNNANQIASIYNDTVLGKGFDNVRGFITNTANYSPVQEAFNYDQYLAGILHGDPNQQQSFYSWNNVYDESSYIAEIMSINSNGQLSVDGNHRISAPTSALYAGKYFLIDTSRDFTAH